MPPPVARPIPRFVADAPVEGLPYGRWAQQLRDAFAKACEPHVGEAGGPPGEVTWFPERGWGGRVYVPAIAAVEGAASPSEYFGYVSFTRTGDGTPGDLRAVADFTDDADIRAGGLGLDAGDLGFEFLKDVAHGFSESKKW